MLTPPIPDRAGRGELCAKIDAITKDLLASCPEGTRPDRDKCERLGARLDKERQKFHRLYDFTPPPQEE
jgi:hypothetical protein